MKRIICILVFLLVMGIVFADEYGELKNLVREGDKVLLDEIQKQNAECTATVNERYNSFIGGIETRIAKVLFIERVTLLIGLVCALLLAWGIQGLIDIYVNRKRAKGFLLKMQNIEQMIKESYDFLNKKDLKQASKKYQQIAKLYTRLDGKGRTYIYQKVLDLQKGVMYYGKNG